MWSELRRKSLSLVQREPDFGFALSLLLSRVYLFCRLVIHGSYCGLLACRWWYMEQVAPADPTAGNSKAAVVATAWGGQLITDSSQWATNGNGIGMDLGPRFSATDRRSSRALRWSLQSRSTDSWYRFQHFGVDLGPRSSAAYSVQPSKVRSLFCSLVWCAS